MAELYQVSTKVLNQAVKRSVSRFPQDFMFQLTAKEKDEVVTICDHLRSIKFSHTLPYAFTEQGVAMLSSVLNSERAIQVNIQIIRTFSMLRQMVASNKNLQSKINEIIRVHGVRLKEHDEQIKGIIDAINQLLQPPDEKSKKKYGFLADRE